MKRRYACEITYDGTPYVGWQAQQGLPSVQFELEKAFSYVANHAIDLTCAGRTDKGVHATAQVVHFDTVAERSDAAWIFGVNRNLPQTISVQRVVLVDPEFHARFSALSRRYVYVVYNHRVRPTILSKAVTHIFEDLDVDQMSVAAQALLGEHDFTSFRGSGCESKTPFRCVHQLKVIRRSELVIFDIEANAFLLHMVRNIVGALLMVGTGRKSPDWIKDVLNMKDRQKAAACSPSSGLYLIGVKYPRDFNYAGMMKKPFFLSEYLL